jgi:hypothetical protein
MRFKGQRSNRGMLFISVIALVVVLIVAYLLLVGLG